jgi:hypothetical protein
MWQLGGGLMVVVLVGIIGALVISRNVATDDPQSQDNGDESAETVKRFPVLTGNNLMLSTSNLLGEELTVPQDWGGELKLIVVAYDSDQQPDVDGWLEPLEGLNADFPELKGYYIPLLPKSAADAAVVIIGGMYLGAGNDENRERTVVVFTDVEEFNRLVAVESVEEIRLFLVGEDDVILWESAGPFQEETIGELRAVLEESE